MTRVCAECGTSDSDSGLFPFFRNGRQMYVCFNCMTSHRGMLRYVCPPCMR